MSYRRIALASQDKGALWITSNAALGGFDAASAEPVLTDAKGLVATVGTDDVIYAANPARGELTALKLDAGGAIASSEAADYAARRNIDNAQTTAVGDKSVVLDPATGSLYLAGGKKVALPDTAGARLQQSGPPPS